MLEVRRTTMRFPVSLQSSISLGFWKACQGLDMAHLSLGCTANLDSRVTAACDYHSWSRHTWFALVPSSMEENA